MNNRPTNIGARVRRRVGSIDLTESGVRKSIRLQNTESDPIKMILNQRMISDPLALVKMNKQNNKNKAERLATGNRQRISVARDGSLDASSNNLAAKLRKMKLCTSHVEERPRITSDVDSQIDVQNVKSSYDNVHITNDRRRSRNRQGSEDIQKGQTQIEETQNLTATENAVTRNLDTVEGEVIPDLNNLLLPSLKQSPPAKQVDSMGKTIRSKNLYNETKHRRFNTIDID